MLARVIRGVHFGRNSGWQRCRQRRAIELLKAVNSRWQPPAVSYGTFHSAKLFYGFARIGARIVSLPLFHGGNDIYEADRRAKKELKSACGEAIH